MLKKRDSSATIVQVEITPHDQDTSQPLRPMFMKTLGLEIVNITVGQKDKQETFMVHKNILTKKAPVFGKMFNSGFSEAVSGHATLPEDSPDAFDVFVEWLYTGSLTGIDPSKSEGGVWESTVVDLMRFADKYNVNELSDRVLSIWIRFHAKIKDVDKITLLFNSTIGPHCLVRLWAVRMIAFAIVKSTTSICVSELTSIIGHEGDVAMQVLEEDQEKADLKYLLQHVLVITKTGLPPDDSTSYIQKRITAPKSL